jgi:DNA-binding PadR family transcriptional regulator
MPDEARKGTMRVKAMSKKELVSSYILEMRRGTVVLCVLAKLRQPTYGYDLIAQLKDTGIAIEANTLYPLLRRLEEQGLLSSTWNTEGAKPRKYYVATKLGKEVLAELTVHWRALSTSLETMLEG